MNTSNKSDANVARQIAQAVMMGVVLADSTQAMSSSSLRVAIADADRRMRNSFSKCSAIWGMKWSPPPKTANRSSSSV